MVCMTLASPLNKAFNIWTEVKAKVLEEENTTPKFKDMVDIRRIAAEWQASFQAEARRRWKK
jgi:hypothetical protein